MPVVHCTGSQVECFSEVVDAKSILFIHLLRSHPYYNLLYCTWVPSMSAGLSHVIRAAMQNVYNLLHSILHTFRLEIARRDPISRC